MTTYLNHSSRSTNVISDLLDVFGSIAGKPFKEESLLFIGPGVLDLLLPVELLQ
jgi:hypothetical protein